MERTTRHIAGIYYGILTLVLLFGLLFISDVNCEKAILLDTRTALSDLGWTFASDSQWQEVTSNDKSGKERRMLMVCEIKKPNQDNWIRSQYINVQGANRIYVEIEFTIRSCEDVPNVATCKETFNLYYYETDRDEATSTFPPWNEEAYTKVDTVAADQRFQPGSSDTNFETRDIGPISKGGIYLAVQDTGACVALMHVRVYYKYCDVNTTNLATFARTTTGPEVTSLVEAKGSCVRNAVTVPNGLRPSLYCNGKGLWTVPTGTCLCTAGYEPNNRLTQCIPCRTGFYKSAVANQACQSCPDYSNSNLRGSTLCDCMPGYFRAHSDTPDVDCTKPSTKPTNLFLNVNKTSITLTWDVPHNTWGRNDLTYEVKCQKCRPKFVACEDCRSGLRYIPSQTVTSTDVVITSLLPYAYYKLKVCAVNGVTNVAMESGKPLDNCAESRVETNQEAPPAVTGLQTLGVSDTWFTVGWDEFQPPEVIVSYEVVIELVDVSLAKSTNGIVTWRNNTTERQMTVTSLQSGHVYSVKVRAQTAAGFGPYSVPIRVKTTITNENALMDSGNDSTPTQGVNVPIIAIAVGGGIIFLALFGIFLYCLRYRTKKSLRRKKFDPEKLKAGFNGKIVQFNGNLVAGHKTYIDPTTYEDPHRAVREFTKEIETAHVKIEQVIGGGEFGEVCKGKLHVPNKAEQNVAVKRLKSGYNSQQKLDFLGEASIMGQFDHPNVIRLEGVVTRSRPFMIITEYMENGSLDAFLRNHDNELTVIQLVGMLRNISEGMKYLSEMGYIHRDLAARNILVDSELICKVSDFGMSRVLENEEDASYTTRGGKIPIRWTAPEAITFQKFTSASDVWSYGIVMWEVMSYGERPYWGMSNQDVMKAVENGYRLPAPMDCPQVQHKLMLDCWKTDRNQRPKFGQIASSLDKMLRDPTQLKIKVTNGRSPSVPTSNMIPARATTLPLGSVKTPLSDLRSTPISVPKGNSASFANEEANETSPMLNQSTPTDGRTLRDPKTHAEMTPLDAWLAVVGLPQYKDNFTRYGCTAAEQISQINLSDLTKMGIIEKTHQEALLNSINKVGLPTYAESTVLHPHVGISV